MRKGILKNLKVAFGMLLLSAPILIFADDFFSDEEEAYGGRAMTRYDYETTRAYYLNDTPYRTYYKPDKYRYGNLPYYSHYSRYYNPRPSVQKTNTRYATYGRQYENPDKVIIIQR